MSIIGTIGGGLKGLFTADSVKAMALDQLTQQMPHLFGIGPDDEAIISMVEANLDIHYPGDVAFITQVRDSLTEEERKRWRLVVTKMDTTKLNFTEPGVAKTKKTPVVVGHESSDPNLTATRRQGQAQKATKGKPIIDHVIEEVYGDRTKIEIELSTRDPRIQHLHYVASLVRKHLDKPTDKSVLRQKRVYNTLLAEGVAEAVSYLRMAHLSEVPFTKFVLAHIASAFGWTEEKATQHWQSLVQSSSIYLKKVKDEEDAKEAQRWKITKFIKKHWFWGFMVVGISLIIYNMNTL